MEILITNDDGIHAPGLSSLFSSLSRSHRVRIVAPEAERSAVGHSITLADPIRVKEVDLADGVFGFAVSGTPADCVRLGASELLDPSPEMVVSGVNLGANVGINILYSGTVSAATEAAIIGLPALSISLDSFSRPDFRYAAEIALKLVNEWPELNLPRGVSLNINVPDLPPDKIKGLAWARQCLTPAGEEFLRRIDPRENVYYWRGREIHPDRPGDGTDFQLLAEGYVTLLPLQHDLTAHEELNRLKKKGPLL